MTIDLLVSIITASVSFLLGMFIILKNPKHATNVYFGLLIFALGFYTVFNYAALRATSDAEALLWAKFILLSAIPAGPIFFMFVNVFPGNKFIFNKRLQYPLFAWMALNVILAFSGLIFSAVKIVGGQPQLTPGPAIPSFALSQVISVLAGSIILIRKYRRAEGLLKRQLEYITYGIVFSFGLMLLATLVIPVVFGNSGLIGISPIFLLVAESAIAYSIVSARLLNIRAVVARSVAYVLLLIVLASIYGIGIFGVSSILFANQATIPLLQQVIYVMLAVFLAFTFQPLKNFFEQLTDRIFFRDRYDSQEVLSEMGQILVVEFKLERLLRKSLVKICQDLSIGSAQFYVFDAGAIYKVEHYGAVPHKMITAGHLQTLHRRTLVADELPDGREKQLMEEFGYRVVMHLRTREEFVGYLLLGDKLSGDIYTSQDLEVLEILSQELAVAISNAKAYEDIAEFNATLQDKVDDATKRLRTANIHLKELDAAKDEFISMASHQLRTPLTTIKGYLSMLQEGDAGKMSKEQLEFINYAYTGSQRMVNLISDLLNVSRMSAGKFLIEKSAVDLNQMAAEEVQQLQSHAVAKNLKLTYEPPKDKLPPIELDDNKTRQVLMNFIDNAVYYTKEGSVTVSLAKAGDSVELRVKDTGIGVPPDAQKKLFTKFFRAGNAQTVRPDGTGLGLYLAKRVIEDQGGTIIFETAEGKGSTFGFSMPLKAKKVTADGKSK